MQGINTNLLLEKLMEKSKKSFKNPISEEGLLFSIWKKLKLN